MSIRLYTIGHSNRSLEDFIGLLQSQGINVLVDVRSQPHSRRYPQFSMENLRTELEQANITYHWAGRQLGGMRKPISNSIHTALQDESLRAYADHMETENFTRGAYQLIRLARQDVTAIMCAEKLPQNCHRSLLSDYLLLQDVEICHIIDISQLSEHYLNPCARRESSQLIYDRNTTASLL